MTSVFKDEREEIIFRWNTLLEQQNELRAAIEKYIDDFGQMPWSDEALEALNFGMAHVIHSYTLVHGKALKTLRGEQRP
jgi:predicted DNA-binding protein